MKKSTNILEDILVVITGLVVAVISFVGLLFLVTALALAAASPLILIVWLILQAL